MDEFPNILYLGDLILTIPASSADVERGFSQLKLTKLKIRSSLLSAKVTDLMTIQLHSPAVKDFVPQEAIDLWYSGGVRTHKTTQKPYGPGLQTQQ